MVFAYRVMESRVVRLTPLCPWWRPIQGKAYSSLTRRLRSSFDSVLGL